MQKSYARFVGLDPFAVDNKLGNRALAHLRDNFLGRAGDRFNVDLNVGDTMLIEEAFGLSAVAAPGRCVNDQSHILMINAGRIIRLVRSIASTQDRIGDLSKLTGDNADGPAPVTLYLDSRGLNTAQVVDQDVGIGESLYVPNSRLILSWYSRPSIETHVKRPKAFTSYEFIWGTK